MLRWIGGLTSLLSLLVPTLWLQLAGASGSGALGIVLAFVPVLLVGGGLWMWGMARAEVEEAARWARVDAAVAEARRRLVEQGRMPVPVRAERRIPRPRPRPERPPRRAPGHAAAIAARKPPDGAAVPLPAPATAAARMRAG